MSDEKSLNEQIAEATESYKNTIPILDGEVLVQCNWTHGWGFAKRQLDTALLGSDEKKPLYLGISRRGAGSNRVCVGLTVEEMRQLRDSIDVALSLLGK